TYDILGQADQVVIKDGSTTISTTDSDYDALGQVRQDTTLSTTGTLLSRRKYNYDSDGLPKETIVSLTTTEDVTTSMAYSPAGNLTQVIEAVGAQYYSLYAGVPVSIQQTTSYSYFGDGSLSSSELSGQPGTFASSDRYYADPAAEDME